MYDQSFNFISISRMLRKNDFYLMPQLRDPVVRQFEIAAAVALSDMGFANYSFLQSSKLRGKSVFRISEFSQELVLRKIDKNLQKAKPLYSPSRDTIVSNIKNLVSESVQCKVYRLDIKSFYESFDIPSVQNVVEGIKGLAPQTKCFIKDILNNFSASGGSGLPRGLSLSATLSEIVMNSFDKDIKSIPGVYFYSRYVDDIIIITSGKEHSKQFIKKICSLLPHGLILNKKKEDICSVVDSAGYKPSQHPVPPLLFSFEYLGYAFNVYDVQKNCFRDVIIDIAESKINKIKTRLTKAFIDYCRNKNFDLLEMRVKFLTSNFSVLDVNRGAYRLAGIYHNYHRITLENSKALDDLDEYLRRATLSSYGKVFNEFYCNTTTLQRRRILTFSFKCGFVKKIYIHFNRSQFREIRECWEYA